MKISIIIPILGSQIELETIQNLNNHIRNNLIDFDYEINMVIDGECNKKHLTIEFEEAYGNLDKWNFIINDEPIGIFESRRKGLKKATGDFVWFVDSTDRIYNVKKEYLLEDFDMYSFQLAYICNEQHNCAQLQNIKEGTNTIQFKKLNPITSKLLSIKFINNFIGNYIFKKDYISTVYDKLPEIKHFNKFASLYTNAAALKFVRNFKHFDSYIYIYTFKNKDYLEHDETSKNNNNLYLLNCKNIFTNNEVEILKTHLEKDTVRVSDLILTYIEDCTKTIEYSEISDELDSREANLSIVNTNE